MIFQVQEPLIVGTSKMQKKDFGQKTPRDGFCCLWLMYAMSIVCKNWAMLVRF